MLLLSDTSTRRTTVAAVPQDVCRRARNAAQGKMWIQDVISQRQKSPENVPRNQIAHG